MNHCYPADLSLEDGSANPDDIVTPVIPANLQMNDVRAAFDALPTQATRQYYECPTPPTETTGLIESHFKGVARYGNKFIFTYTNLDPFSCDKNGKYLIGDMISAGDQGEIDQVGDTAHRGWCHPCAAQACGSFMAMGIQQSANGSSSTGSEIQIYDLRNCLDGEPITLLGTIQRTDGINGVGMGKEAGPDGKYVVAGVNGNALTVYRSTTSSLLPWGATEFVEVLQVRDFPDSGAGLALITQTDGGIFLISMKADDDGSNSLIGLYKLELDTVPAACLSLTRRKMAVPGISDALTDLESYLEKDVPVWGAILAALLRLANPVLNSSFRWGKGLSITSSQSMEIYATDRNVIPPSLLPNSVSKKDFSVVVWASGPGVPGIVV